MSGDGVISYPARQRKGKRHYSPRLSALRFYLRRMTDKLRAYLYLHFCVLIWGFTAILGKLISLQAVPLVWWRVFLCCATLVFLIPRAQFRGISRRLFLQMFGIGVIVGIHWLCFYGAIKLSNASVAVATMATTSFFSALVEPALTRQKIKGYELALGLLILPGMALIAGNIDWGMRVGFAVGIVGALLAAVFSSLNKRLVDNHPPPPLVMSFTELAGGVAVCSLALPFLFWQNPETPFLPTTPDWGWLFVLAWVCTLLPYYLTLLAMRHITAFATNLTINLEPVYGVLLAAVFFHEHEDLNPQFYIGVIVILLAVFSHPFLKKYFDP
jgi:drug/metabolite transporter (DMT)-like permease